MKVETGTPCNWIVVVYMLTDEHEFRHFPL